MVGLEAKIDMKQASSINEALYVYGKALGDASALAPKIVALQLCDGLKKRTKKAPKKARSNEYSADYSKNPPPYITYKNGKKLPRPIHRWTLTRKLGTPDQYARDHYVYVHTKETKKGKIVKDKAAELRELKQYHLGIAHAGLAKIAWNKTKDEIKRGASDIVWKKRKNDRRIPLNDVHGSYSKSGTVNVTGVAEIHNHLDYAESALEAGAFQSASEATTNKILHKAKEKLTNGGVDIETAKRKVEELLAEFRAKVYSF